MTRKDIIRELSKRTGLSPSQSTHAVNGVIDIFADTLVSGETIYLRGFGTIKTVQRAAKTGRDISRGTNITIPPCKQVKFITCNELKARINRKEEN